MGMIANQLKAQLADMKARHAETDRKVASLIEEAHEALNDMALAQGALEALLED